MCRVGLNWQIYLGEKVKRIKSWESDWRTDALTDRSTEAGLKFIRKVQFCSQFRVPHKIEPNLTNNVDRRSTYFDNVLFIVTQNTMILKGWTGLSISSQRGAVLFCDSRFVRIVWWTPCYTIDSLCRWIAGYCVCT